MDGLTGITSGNNAVATVFGPAAPATVGRILDHLSGGSLGTYSGVAGETMDELFDLPGDGHERPEQPRERTEHHVHGHRPDLVLDVLSRTRL